MLAQPKPVGRPIAFNICISSSSSSPSCSFRGTDRSNLRQLMWGAMQQYEMHQVLGYFALFLLICILLTLLLLVFVLLKARDGSLS